MPPEFEWRLVRVSFVDLVAKQIRQSFCSQSKNVIRRQRRATFMRFAGAVATLTGDFNVKPRGGVSRSSAMRCRTDSDGYLFPIVGEQIRIRETFLRGQVASAPPRSQSQSLPYKAREIGHFGPRPKSRIADRKEVEGARARRRRRRWRRLGS